jgi:Uma2 family endonuclease
MLEDQSVDVAVVQQHTPEDLLVMPEGHRFELIDGQLKERNMGAWEAAIAARVMRHVGNHVEREKLGTCFAADCGYQIFADDPKKVRFPDGSFVARGRFPQDQVPPGHLRTHPDLAVEVVSPNDLGDEIEAKRIAFLRAGTRLWWLIYPVHRTVHVYRNLKNCVVFADGEELTDDEVLPGFRCPVRAFFED